MSLKAKMKQTFAGRLLISYLHCFESWIMPKLVDDKTAVERFYQNNTGHKLDLNSPKSFSEKMNWYKLFGRIPLMSQCADKVGVREYVKSCGLEDTLNEIYGIYTRVGDIPFNSLPDSYVIKAAHGSHMSIIKRPGERINIWQSKLMINSWLHQNIYWAGREWVYKNVPKRIIAERYLEDETGELRDYKFFCYHGVPHFLQYDAGRFKNEHYRNFYDMDLNLLDITDDSTKTNPDIVAIDRLNFERMKEIASVLSKPFQFVRCDLYFVCGKIYFGELTFFDGGGYSGFSKEEYDILFGEPWIIENHEMVNE